MLPLWATVDLGVMAIKRYIPQSSNITGASTSDCLVSYLGHSLREPYPFVETQSVYSTAPANWARAQLEFELTHYDITVQLVSYRDPPPHHYMV